MSPAVDGSGKPGGVGPPVCHGKNTKGSPMDVMSLAVLTAVCGGAAIYLWMSTSKLQDQLAGLRARADKAEAESGKATERAETLRKKLEKQGAGNAAEDRSAKESRARAAEAKEEVAKTRAALKRAEQTAEELAAKLRKADSRIDELQVMANVKRPAPIAPPVVEVVVQEIAAPAEPPPPPAPREDDPRWQLRRAELDAEREQRELEKQRLRQERETLRATQDDERLRETVGKLQAERDRWRHEAMVREMDLRLSWRKEEHNRRAYMMTMGALDLAEDELYRIKHGRERPEFTPTRAANIAPAFGVEVAPPQAGGAFDAEEEAGGQEHESIAAAVEAAPAIAAGDETAAVEEIGDVPVSAAIAEA